MGRALHQCHEESELRRRSQHWVTAAAKSREEVSSLAQGMRRRRLTWHVVRSRTCQSSAGPSKVPRLGHGTVPWSLGFCASAAWVRSLASQVHSVSPEIPCSEDCRTARASPVSGDAWIHPSSGMGLGLGLGLGLGVGSAPDTAAHPWPRDLQSFPAIPPEGAG